MISISAHSVSHANSLCEKGVCSPSPLSDNGASRRANNPSSLPKVIRPIDIIEEWVLCHHLGWVVQYLARATNSDSLLEQTCLKKTHFGQRRFEQTHQRLTHLENAEWYLKRELTRFPKCALIPMEPHSITTQQVIKDWGLSFHLGQTLFYLKTSLLSYRRQEALECAMGHLREEIKVYKAECGLYEHQINNQKAEGGK